MLRVSVVAAAGPARSPRQGSRRVLPAVLALAFGASAALTVLGSTVMGPMDAMPMPGGWTLSMAWVRMGGQGWLAAAAAFLLMWMPMMVAMMLPSVGPVLSRYRDGLESAAIRRPGCMAAAAGLGYFLVWAAAGAAIYPLGAAGAQAVMYFRWLAPAVPLAAAVTVVLAGALQVSAWKARRLACCRAATGHLPPQRIDMAGGVRHGVRLGLDCARCCGPLMAVALVAGLMDLRVMAAVTLAITAERLLPAGERVARGTGLLAIGLGLLLIVRAAGVP